MDGQIDLDLDLPGEALEKRRRRVIYILLIDG